MKNGDCYEAAGKLMMDFHSPGQDSEAQMKKYGRDPKMTLVHAEVMGQGELAGITFGHAFVIVDTWHGDARTAYDHSNGRNLELPAAFYFMMGKINEIDNYYEYEWPEAQEFIMNTGQWGPWELETKSGY
jgi:hypothetical protein